MLNNLTLAEQKFEEFLPILINNYPKERKNKADIARLTEAYRDISFSENVVVILHDHRTASLFHISENVEKISGGYTPKQMIKWGGLLLFKILHYTHYSYVYRTLKYGIQLSKKFTREENLNSRSYCSGLKLVDVQGNIRNVFLKNRVLTVNEKNQIDLVVVFAEEITHLVKGNHYWIRHVTPNRTMTYVNQSGKKEFKDIISESEKPVLELLAKKKSTAEIAELLHLSKLTVETHRKNMIKRVGAVDSTALVHLCKMANVI